MVSQTTPATENKLAAKALKDAGQSRQVNTHDGLNFSEPSFCCLNKSIVDSRVWSGPVSVGVHGYCVLQVVYLIRWFNMFYIICGEHIAIMQQQVWTVGIKVLSRNSAHSDS